jgi:diguanylate cyclase (GGDEF)-like protein
MESMLLETAGPLAATTHIECCLVNQRGEIVAADSRFNRRLGDSAARAGRRVRPLLRLVEDCHADRRASPTWAQLFDQEQSPSFTARLAAGPDQEHVIRFSACRLLGAEGPLLLLTVSAERDPSAPPCDPLTGLPNRLAIGACIDAWRHRDAVTPFALLFLDLDDFKQVNDYHGHLVGDHVLSELARRWTSCVREVDLVARYGGDEFVILLKGATGVHDAEPVLRRLAAATRKPITLDGLVLELSATVGTAFSDGLNGSVDELLVTADQDMYDRKRRRPR